MCRLELKVLLLTAKQIENSSYDSWKNASILRSSVYSIEMSVVESTLNVRKVYCQEYLQGPSNGVVQIQ